MSIGISGSEDIDKALFLMIGDDFIMLNAEALPRRSKKTTRKAENILVVRSQKKINIIIIEYFLIVYASITRSHTNSHSIVLAALSNDSI